MMVESASLSLLYACSRGSIRVDQKDQLEHYCRNITDWLQLFEVAEQHGVGPLLFYHLEKLEVSYPKDARRTLRLIALRHQRLNSGYIQELAEVLTLLAQADIAVLVLKGAALCHITYSEIGLRPMRDIDLLLQENQIHQAQELLLKTGYVASTAPRPADHFHLPSLHKTINGISVCIELHHDLFPKCPPYYRPFDFATLWRRSMRFLVNGVKANGLGAEDMLWHVFEHGFHMPLTYESFKLIFVADIITLTETKLAQIDWSMMQREYPQVLAALPLLHHLCPFSPVVLTEMKWLVGPVPAGVGKSFQGWPHVRLSEVKDKHLFTVLHDTFLPPEWWCRIYYGVMSNWDWYVCRCVRHPRHVFWWVRLYSNYFDGAAEVATKGYWGRKTRKIAGIVIKLLDFGSKLFESMRR